MVVHLTGILIFPSWGTGPDPVKERIFKIKAVVEKPEKRVQKKLPEPEQKINREVSKPAKQPQPFSLEMREKTPEVKSVKAVRPSPAVRNIPEPIQIPQQSFQPMKAMQPNSTIKDSAARVRKSAEMKTPSVRPATPRPLQPNTTIMASSSGIRPRQPQKSFLNRKRANSKIATRQAMPTSDIASPQPTAQRRHVQEVALMEFSKAPAVTFQDARGEFKKAAFASAKIFSDDRPEEILFTRTAASKVHSAAGGRISHAHTVIQAQHFKTLNQGASIAPASAVRLALTTVSGPSGGVQKRSPQGLDSDISTTGNPALAAAEDYSPAPFGTASMAQMVSIPYGFIEEAVDGSGKTNVASLSKKNNSTGGTNDISPEQMGKIKKTFLTQVRSKIAQTKYYPRTARRRGLEGEPVVVFTLGNNGNLIAVSINNPSRYKLLDKAALDAVISASPYPPIPEPLKMKTIRFKLPISFILE